MSGQGDMESISLITDDDHLGEVGSSWCLHGQVTIFPFVMNKHLIGRGVCKYCRYPPQAFASRFCHPVKDLAYEDFYCDAGLVVILYFSHSPWTPLHGYAEISEQSSCTWRLSLGWSPKLPPASALGIPSPPLTCDLSRWQFGLENQTLKATQRWKATRVMWWRWEGLEGSRKLGAGSTPECSSLLP